MRRISKGAGRRAAICLSAATVLCSAHAAPALALAGNTSSVSGTAGMTVSGAVATFTDGTLLLACTTASAYSATINWGDGSTSAGSVSESATALLGACNYRVDGSHTYAEAGSYPISVTITAPDGTLETGAATATIADAPLSAAGINFSATRGTAFTTTVATFADANSLAKASDFTASIAWGDGSPAGGTVTAIPGGFAVSATHTYTATGDFKFTVAILDVGGSQAQASATASVLGTPTVTPPPVTTTPPPAKTPTKTPLHIDLSRPIPARGGTVVVGVSCPTAAELCRGRLTVTALASPHSKIAALRSARVLGTTLFIIPGGSKAELSVRPKQAVVAMYRKAGSAHIQSVVSYTAATGQSGTATLKTTLRLT